MQVKIIRVSEIDGNMNVLGRGCLMTPMPCDELAWAEMRDGRLIMIRSMAYRRTQAEGPRHPIMADVTSAFRLIGGRGRGRAANNVHVSADDDVWIIDEVLDIPIVGLDVNEISDFVDEFERYTTGQQVELTEEVMSRIDEVLSQETALVLSGDVYTSGDDRRVLLHVPAEGKVYVASPTNDPMVRNYAHMWAVRMSSKDIKAELDKVFGVKA